MIMPLVKLMLKIFRDKMELIEKDVRSNIQDNQDHCSSSTSVVSKNSAHAASAEESLKEQNTKLFLGGEWIEIPNIIFENESMFRSIVSKDSFNKLSQTAKEHLKHYLPQSAGITFDDMLDCTFTDDKNFCFGNPVDKFYKKIRDGYFTAADHVQLRDHKRVLYDHYIRHYQMNLLKKLLTNRHALLEKASKSQSVENVKLPTKDYYSQRKSNKCNNIQRRARIRAKRMLDDCRVKAGENPGYSSDESAPESDLAVQPIPANARSTMFVEKFAADLDLYQPVQLKEVPELYREYCYLRESEPDCPSLDITDITLEEVYERTGISFQTERNFAKITEQNLMQSIGKKSWKQKEKAETVEKEPRHSSQSSGSHEALNH